MADENKIGARNAQEDYTRLQQIHDLSTLNGALCPDPTRYEPKAYIWFGDHAKALGDGRVGGYLVTFGSPEVVDLEGEFFTKETNFGTHTETPVFYQHGFDETMDVKQIGNGILKFDDIGVWIEAQLEMRDEYEKAVYQLVEADKLGWSSGTAGHLMLREPQGKAVWIKQWLLGLDASLTPTPAEPRNHAIPMKTLPLVYNLENTQVITTVGTTTNPINHKHIVEPPLEQGVKNMEKDELIKLLDERDQAKQAQVDSENKRLADLKTAEEAGYKKAQEELKNANRAGFAVPNLKRNTELGFADEETKSFLHWIRTGDDVPYKAAMQGQTDAEGGYAVPDDFGSQVIAKRNEASVPASLSGLTRLTTGLDRILVPVEGTSATKFVVTAEEGNYDENEPTLGQVAITIHKLTKLIKISEELEGDARANFGGWLAGVWGRAMAAADNYYLVATGTGTGQPQSMVVGGTVGFTTAGATAIVAADMHSFIHAMPDPYVTGMVMIMSRATLGVIRSLLVATPYAFVDWVNPVGNGLLSPNGTIAGIPVYCTNAMPTSLLANGKTVLLINPAMYAVAEREGMTISRNPYLYQLSGQIGLFAKYRQGGAVLQSEGVLYLLQHA